MTIVALPTPDVEAQKSVIDIAREILKLAESGEITELCAALIYRGGNTGSIANQTNNRTKRVGAVALLLHELTSEK